MTGYASLCKLKIQLTSNLLKFKNNEYSKKAKKIPGYFLDMNFLYRYLYFLV